MLVDQASQIWYWYILPCLIVSIFFALGIAHTYERTPKWLKALTPFLAVVMMCSCLWTYAFVLWTGYTNPQIEFLFAKSAIQQALDDQCGLREYSVDAGDLGYIDFGDTDGYRWRGLDASCDYRTDDHYNVHHTWICSCS